MINHRLLISSILLLSATLTGCSENIDEAGHQTDNQTQTAAQTSEQLKAARNIQSFPNFFQFFFTKVQNSEWTDLAEMSIFPFILTGELDADPKVILDKQGFINIIGELFKEEVYISFKDQLIATNYRNIILNRQQQLEIESDEAQLFGLQFVRVSDSWKFSGITTHVHIIEKYEGDQ